ncbi:MAG TPA: tetratricopeptide repeat protein [Myxococcota bacterium]|nr:tetratricopeptide repeat protein [Myxococcota bacterium]
MIRRESGATPRPRALTEAERRCYDLGRQRWERGDRDGALQAFERFLESRREFADVHYMVGMLREQADDLASAADSLREALRLNPAYAEAMVALASIYERLGEYSRSRALAERVAQQALPSAGALDATTRGKLANLEADLADAYREAGALPDAIEAYRKALDRCPTFHDIRYRLGIALREAGLPDRALAEFARVRRANPDLLDAAVQTGLTLYTLGRGEDAIAEWRGVLERDRTREDARMYLRMVARAVGGPAEPPEAVLAPDPAGKLRA